MKLLDILASEMKDWPSTRTGAVGQSESGSLHLNQDARHGSDFFGWTTFKFKMAEDWKTAWVTRSEWQAAVDALNQSELDAVLAKNEQLAAARAERIPVWNGEGLPPVGLDVEIKRGNCTWIDGDEWQIGKTATVMASFLNSRDIEMASVQFPGGHCECILARCLSPVRTAEQVAAEEREKAIKDMMEVTSDGISCIGQDDALALYKAGYRKETKPCGS